MATSSSRQLLAPKLRRIALQLLLLLGIYAGSRIVFTLVNHAAFEGLSVPYFLYLAFHGIRYDVSALLTINLIYILLLFLPLVRGKVWDRILQLLFVVVNAVALLFEFSDWAYFPFNFRRANADVLFMVGRKGDFLNLLPHFIIEFWYVPVAWLLTLWLLITVNKRICRRTQVAVMPAPKWRTALAQLGLLVVVMAVSLIGIRGGFQYIPIGIRNAIAVTDSRYVPVVLNTPFSIISSAVTPGVEEVHYMPDAEAVQLIQPVKQYKGKAFRPKNVVVIILESFSKEFTCMGPGPSYTPFLDSLMQYSLVCTQAYANGQRSNEGIPAIVAGIPALMSEGFITSSYGADRIDALPKLLHDKGYHSAFYHGGADGTMSFDVFAASAGYDHYFGRTEYANDKDYDGNWGIRDEPYLQYFSKQLDGMQQPFFASVFTLSAHPPYTLPNEWKGRAPKGTLPIHPTVFYSDNALREFFAASAGKPWFKNTLFVITPDHCAPATTGGYYAGNMGRFAIPILYYAPGDATLQGTYDVPTQQIDIMPSVLDYLGYGRPFFAFGRSIFQKDSTGFVVNSNNSFFQFWDKGRLWQTMDEKPLRTFAFPADSACLNNLLPQLEAANDTASMHRLKALLQLYNNGLIHNQISAATIGK